MAIKKRQGAGAHPEYERVSRSEFLAIQRASLYSHEKWPMYKIPRHWVFKVIKGVKLLVLLIFLSLLIETAKDFKTIATGLPNEIGTIEVMLRFVSSAIFLFFVLKGINKASEIRFIPPWERYSSNYLRKVDDVPEELIEQFMSQMAWVYDRYSFEAEEREGAGIFMDKHDKQKWLILSGLRNG